MPADQALEQVLAFGVAAGTRNPVHFVDDETILFQVGANVVLYNMVRQMQSFFPCLQETTSIAAISVSPNKRFLALSENGVKPCVSIWDLSQAKRVRNLSFLELSGCVIEHIAFSQDCRTILMLVGEPKFSAMLVSLELSSVKASQSGVYSADHPIEGLVTGNDGEFIAYGDGILKVFKVMDKSMKTLTPTLGKVVKARFTAACCTPTGFLVGMSDGQVLSIQQGEMKKSISSSELVPLKYMMPENSPVAFISMVSGSPEQESTRNKQGQQGTDFNGNSSNKGDDTGRKNKLTKGEYVLALDCGIVEHFEITDKGAFRHIYTTSLDIARQDLQDSDYSTKFTNMNMDDIVGDGRDQMARPNPNEFILNMKCHGASISKSGGLLVMLCSTIGFCAPLVINIMVTEGSAAAGKIIYNSTLSDAYNANKLKNTAGGGPNNMIILDSSFHNIGNSEIMILDQLPHSGEVKYLAFATQKPVFISSGSDRSIRGWDFIDGKLVSRTQFPDTINSIDLHTSGLSVAVATGDSVKLCSLSDRVYINHEISIPNAKLIKYSTGGQYLAIVNANNEINVYNTWARSLVCVLQGHSGKVTDLVWMPDKNVVDRYIGSISNDGSFYVWDIIEGKRIKEVIRKGLKFIKMCPVDKGNSMFLLLSSDGNIYCAYIGSFEASKKGKGQLPGDLGDMPNDGPDNQENGSQSSGVASQGKSPVQQSPIPLNIAATKAEEDDKVTEIRISEIVPTCMCTDLERGYVYCGTDDGKVVILSIPTIIQQHQHTADIPSGGIMGSSAGSTTNRRPGSQHSGQGGTGPIRSRGSARGGLTNTTSSTGNGGAIGTGTSSRSEAYDGELMTKVVIRLHIDAVEDIIMSPDASVLVTASKDHSISVLSLPGGALTHLPCVLKSSQALASKEKEDTRRRCFTADVLTTSQVLKTHKETISMLQEKVKEVKMMFSYKLKTEEVNSKNSIEKLQEEIKALKDSKELEIVRLKSSSTESEAILLRRIAALEQQHNKAVEQLELEYQDRTIQAKEREQKLQLEITDLKKSHEDELNKLTANFNSKLDEAKASTDKMQAEFEEKIERMQEQHDTATSEFNEIRNMMEEDTDLEIQAIKVQYKNNLLELESTIQGLRGENGSLTKTFATLRKTIQEKTTKLASSEAENQRLSATISSLKHDIMNSQRDLEERDATIADRERRIFDLKKKNQDLEKFKFVLDFKIQELKKQIEPRELEVSDLREQIREMDAELEKYHKVNTALEMAVSDVKLKSDALQKEVLTQRDKLQERENYIKRIEFDISECSPVIQQPQELKLAVRNLLQKYAQGVETTKKIEEQTNVEIEQERHREFLERAVAQLQKKLEKTRVSSKTANQKIMEENAALLKEINLLRHELHTIKQNRKREVQIPNEVQYELESLRMEVQRLRSRSDHKGAGSARSTKPVSREKLPNISRK